MIENVASLSDDVLELLVSVATADVMNERVNVIIEGLRLLASRVPSVSGVFVS